VARFAALLRGINVGRAKRIAMADLRDAFESLGYRNVRTLLNSGNVVFDGPAQPVARHAARIRKSVADDLGVDALVVVKTADEVAGAIAENKLAKIATDPKRLLVVFTTDAKSLAALAPIENSDWGADTFRVGKYSGYAWCASGLLDGKLGKDLLRILADAGTTRNWATGREDRRAPRLERRAMRDKVVVITGASSGIGAALARHLSAEGARVVLVARRSESLAAVARDCRGETLAVTADATAREDVRRAVRAAIDRFGRIDVWVNNAGQGISRPPSELTDADVDTMMRVNVMSALYGMQEVLPQFASRGSGHIVNISSMLGRIPYVSFRSAYCGAKHFLNALTATFRAEMEQSHPGIKVSLVSPAVVGTEFGLHAMHGGPDSRSFAESQSAEEVAAVIAGVIASQQPDVYTRAGLKAPVTEYFAKTGVDPSPEPR